MNDWTNIEVKLIVEDYFRMLSDELSGIPINKSFHRRALLGLLNNRTEGSIEFKHQNISAVLIKLGLPFINGYKPQFNFQNLLELTIIEHLVNQEKNLETKFKEFAESSRVFSEKIDFASIKDEPPKYEAKITKQSLLYSKNPIKINFLELEQKNSELGKKGEDLIVNYEKWRLINLGKHNLANQVTWISQIDDSAGFDILSKNSDGTDRYIEVKTTKLSKETPIYFSKNEYEFSKMQSENYYLYRVFNAKSKPRFFTTNGSFDEFCTKEAVKYRGFF